MKTHQEIRDAISVIETDTSPNPLFRPNVTDILHALNDRIERLDELYTANACATNVSMKALNDRSETDYAKLNDRIERMHKAQVVTVHGCEELTNVVGDLASRLEEIHPTTT